MKNRVVGLGRLLTGFNLRFGRLNDECVLANNFNKIKYNCLNGADREQLVEIFVQKSETSGVSSYAIWIGFKWPMFTFTLAISQVLLFYLGTSGNFEESLKTNFCFDPENSWVEIWRFWTPVLIHFESSHLWQNLTVEILTSTCLEIVYGWKPTLILYFSGAFFANLAILIGGPFQQSCGASGAVFGLITGHLASLIKNWNQVWLARWRCCLITIYLLYCFIIAMFPGNLQIKSVPIITGYSAHFGGAVCGFLIGCLVLEKFGEGDLNWELKLTKYCTLIYFIFGSFRNCW